MLLSNADTYAFGRLNLSEDEGLCDVISLELSELGSRGSTHRENFREHDQSMNNTQPIINLYLNALNTLSDSFTTKTVLLYGKKMFLGVCVKHNAKLIKISVTGQVHCQC